MAFRNMTTPAKMRRLERQAKALELRRSGMSYENIAVSIGMSRTATYNLVRKSLDESLTQIAGDASELRAEELSRLDALLGGIWDEAKSGSYRAIDKVLRIMERKARLLGLDAPIKHSATDPTGEFDRSQSLWVVPPEMSIDEWQQAAQSLVQKH